MTKPIMPHELVEKLRAAALSGNSDDTLNLLVATYLIGLEDATGFFITRLTTGSEADVENSWVLIDRWKNELIAETAKLGVTMARQLGVEQN
jgi:hypothetical protein